MKLLKTAYLVITAVVGMLIAPVTAYADVQTPVSATAGATINVGESFTSGDGRFKLTFQQDGNLVLYQGAAVLWASDKTITNCCHFSHRPLANRVAFQTDGNLVVYFEDGGPGVYIAPWSSNTNGRGVTFDVQNDGNVVIKDASNKVIWKTNTCCH
jgi:hypothetical protein